MQVGVAVMRKMDLRGQTPAQAAERFATALFDQWGPGDKRCHNGVILLLSVEDRQACTRDCNQRVPERNALHSCIC